MAEKATPAEIDGFMIGLKSARDSHQVSEGFYELAEKVARAAGWRPVSWMVHDLTASPRDPGWGPMDEEAADAMVARNPRAYSKMATRRRPVATPIVIPDPVLEPVAPWAER